MTSSFQSHGKTWAPHTPGDPCPCDPDTLVEVLLGSERDGESYEDATRSAHQFDWENDSHPVFSIVGWRYVNAQNTDAQNPDQDFDKQVVLAALPEVIKNSLPHGPEPMGFESLERIKSDLQTIIQAAREATQPK